MEDSAKYAPDRGTDGQTRRIDTALNEVPYGDSWDETEIAELSFQPSMPRNADRRKFVDTTTPTLEDEDNLEGVEDEDEEEMVSLEQERVLRSTQASPPDHQASLRRTPGASQMHQSSRGELLGYGLALTTPIGGKIPRRSPPTSARPPLDPNKREDASYTPASLTLTKNPHLQVNHGSFSPNTLRLTEDLENLLDEADSDEARHNTFRGEEGGESWTTSYIFESEGGTGEKSRLNKSRHQRKQSGRRSRNSECSPSSHTHRQGQDPSFQSQLNPLRRGGAGGAFGGDTDEMPQPLNFGGAFAPPSKDHNFQRPVPSAAPASAHDLPTLSNFAKPFVGSSSQQQPQAFAGQSSQQQPQLLPMMQQQGFHHHAFAPTHHSVHDARIGYVPQPVYNPMDFQRQPHLPPMHAQPPVGYDRSRMGMGSSFVQPNYMQPHIMQQQGWSPLMIGQQQNLYDNREQLPWQGNSSMVESPWVGNSFPYCPPVVVAPRRMTPSPQMSTPYEQQQLWKDPANHSSHPTNSSVAPVPDNCEQSSHQDKEDHPFDEPSSAKLNRGRDSRAKQKKQGGKTSSSVKNEKSRKKTPNSPNKSVVASRRKGRADEPENAEDAKRAELTENPETRAAFKEFYRNFRLKERSSIKEAEQYAVQTLKDGSVPLKTHWRVYLELADLAKRSNRFEEARKLYARVCELQPYANQGWLEYSKLEEECGHMNKSAKILHDGLKYCEVSETLLTRAIKNEEKMNHLGRARELLARLKHVGIEKVWRTVLEGALLEARSGNHLMARRVLKYLMHHVPWYGPLYMEAYRLEKDLGRPLEALAIVEKGLHSIPRYGPLWFGAFRLCETLDFAQQAYTLPRTLRLFERASDSISRELVWKVHLEASQILERAALATVAANPHKLINDELQASRKRMAMTALSCPANLSWKVWLAGGRMELSAGNLNGARKLFLRAHKVVPEKGRVATLLECARLEMFAGDTDLARAILCKSRKEVNSDWKVWLESVLLEVRDGRYERGLALAKQSLEKHSGTGRLWASLVQLRYIEGGEEAQYASLKEALRSVPKSGEVWCEGGRIHLNPFSKLFSLSEARRHLFFATRFTPQYGDGFLETMRLEIIERWVLPVASCVWEAIQPLCDVKQSDSEGWVSSIVVAAVKLIHAAKVGGTFPEFELDAFDKSAIPSLRAQLDTTSLDELFESSNLELRCANADPNYGSMWFHCRYYPTDTARIVLRRAKEAIIADVEEHIKVYIAAIIRGCVLMLSMKHRQERDMKNGAEVNEVDTMPSKAKLLEEMAIQTPSIHAMLKSVSSAEMPAGAVLMERTLSGFHFASGLVALNTHSPLKEMTLLDRKKALFGSDALFS